MAFELTPKKDFKNYPLWFNFGQKLKIHLIFFTKNFKKKNAKGNFFMKLFCN